MSFDSVGIDLGPTSDFHRTEQGEGEGGACQQCYFPQLFNSSINLRIIKY